MEESLELIGKLDDKTARRKRRLLQIDNYISKFSVHGLTRVFKTGKPESFFWLCMLTIGVSVCFTMVHNLAEKYGRRAVYTEIITHIVEKNFFPSITFCERRLLYDAYYAYCNQTMANHFNNPPKHFPCHHPVKNLNDGVSSNNYSWSNGLFEVTYCQTKSGVDCKSGSHLESVVKLNNSCIIWNPHGDLYDVVHSHTDLVFHFHPPPHLTQEPDLIAIPHDPSVSEVDLTGKLSLNPQEKYEIKLDKTVIKRLPAPYPSNCSNENTDNIFPGPYSRYACLESYSYINMYKKCGDVSDYVRNYIPPHIIQKYKKNHSIAEVVQCMVQLSTEETHVPHACRFPCDEVDLDIVSTIQNPDFGLPYGVKKHNVTQNTSWHLYDISIRYRSVDTYNIMEEKELFTWSQMVCQIGGFLGIIIGMSVMSVIEVLVYVVLLLAHTLRTIGRR